MMVTIRILLSVSALSALNLLVTLWIGWPLRPLQPEEILSRVAAIHEGLQTTPNIAEQLHFDTEKVLNTERDLYRPQSLFPTDFGDHIERAQFESFTRDCKAIRDGHHRKWRQPAFAKYFAIHERLCDGAQPNRETLLRPPWMSPSGVSFVFEVAQKLPLSGRSEFLETYRDQLHVLERNDLRLSRLTMTELENFTKGASLFLTSTDIWRLRSANSDQFSYDILPRSQIDQVAQDHGLHVQPHTGEPCQFQDGLLCFQQNPKIHFWQKLFIYSGLCGVVALVTLTLMLLIQRRRSDIQFRTDKELVMQTLAHELRHPVTSLQLSLEVFRDEFDHLTETAQTEFLRMCDQISRLQRLTEASKQYIQTLTRSGHVFAFRFEKVESLNDFVGHAIRDYLNRVDFQPLIQDRAVVIDAYWLTLCVNNLIKNALIHGAKPIRVELTPQGEDVEIRVTDSGQPLQRTLKELVKPTTKSSLKGLGLGLSLVDRIVLGMDGELIYSASPKYFAIRLRGRNA